jgi:hypothetical protein
MHAVTYAGRLEAQAKDYVPLKTERGTISARKNDRGTHSRDRRRPVRYLRWSNRSFSEFGVPILGEDFDQEVGKYLTSHYQRVGPLLPEESPDENSQDEDSDERWTAVVWERKPEVK